MNLIERVSAPVEEERSLALPVLSIPGRMDLARLPWLRRLLASRWPQFLARAVTLAGFVFVILAGLFGSPVGSHNFAIIFVWIAWWTALKLVFIPFGGRSWCSICPIPMPGEWLQRGFVPNLTSKSGRRGLARRWPKALRGSWLQSTGFLLIGLFSAITLTDPRVTAWVLLGLIGLAIGLSLVFDNRAFCSSVCPIGGFTGLYAQAAPLEVRVSEPSVCAAHTEKDCYTACPWGLYPLALKDSAACGLCMECLRVCPKDNIAVNLRPFSSDLGSPRLSSRLDETFLALGMLGSALAFAAVFTGPWGALKMAAFNIGSPAWFGYAAGLLGLNLVVLPGLFALAVWSGQKWAGFSGALRRAIANHAQALLPLGLCAWIAFTISFAFPKANYVLTVLSDPLGWGWNLFGTADLAWMPDVSAFSPALQAGLLLLGLVWSGRVIRDLTHSNDKSSLRQALPLLGFCLAYSLALLWLLIG
ncbi:MAG: 4Fe-4S binding protein [Chloroflexota bacterium]|nr:MAG: 4Fe-4S binding protein [Chloroflexota bacterium]